MPGAVVQLECEPVPDLLNQFQYILSSALSGVHRDSCGIFVTFIHRYFICYCLNCSSVKLQQKFNITGS